MEKILRTPYAFLHVIMPTQTVAIIYSLDSCMYIVAIREIKSLGGNMSIWLP